MATATTTVGTTGPTTVDHDNRRAVRNSTISGTASDTTHVHRAAGPKFQLGAWLRLHGVDLVTMAIIGAIALGIYFAGPASSRSFSIYNVDGSLTNPEFAYPYRKQIIPIFAAALIAFFVPFVFITLFQIKRKSIDDWLTTTLGLLKSLITAATFQVFIKWLIGGLRPHFYAVCQPQISAEGGLTGDGLRGIMFDRTICTGDPKAIDDALESMPSGHSTAAWAGLFYLALYFNAQLKVTAAHNPAYWKMILFFAPILGAFLISASLTIDKYHHWYDVLIGGFIGTATALVAFRQTFASTFDYRFNHILLPRSTSLFHRMPFLPFPNQGPYFTYHYVNEFSPRDLPVSREGGWGYGGGEAVNGAPGDATALAFSGLTNGLQLGHHRNGFTKEGHHGPDLRGATGQAGGTTNNNNHVRIADTAPTLGPVGHNAV